MEELHLHDWIDQDETLQLIIVAPLPQPLPVASLPVCVALREAGLPWSLLVPHTSRDVPQIPAGGHLQQGEEQSKVTERDEQLCCFTLSPKTHPVEHVPTTRQCEFIYAGQVAIS